MDEATVQDRLMNVAAAVGNAATHVQEEGRAIQGKLDSLDRRLLSLGDTIADSTTLLTRHVAKLTDAIERQAASNDKAARRMLMLTYVYVEAALVMAAAALIQLLH